MMRLNGDIAGNGLSLIADQVKTLFGQSPAASELAARSIGELLGRRPVGLIASMNQALRSKGFWHRLGQPMPEVTVGAFEMGRRSPDHELVAAVVGSCLRDGLVREASVRTLSEHRSPLAFSALLVRLTDTFHLISEIAWQAVFPRINAVNINMVAAAVSLVPKFAEWERGTRWPVRQRMITILCQGEAKALWRAAQAPHREDRYAACSLLADKYTDSPRLREVLELALRDTNPQTRRWAAARATNRKTTPESVADSLVPSLLLDPAPSIRLLGLRRLARDESRYEASLMPFVSDPNANVRFYARRFLNRSQQRVDSRGQALSILAKPDSSTGEITGALGALSESGLPADRSIVEPFRASPVRRVAKEAERTLSLLP